IADEPIGAATQATTCTQSQPCVARTSSQSGASRCSPFPASAIPRWPTYTLAAPPQAGIERDRENRRDEEGEHEEVGGHGRREDWDGASILVKAEPSSRPARAAVQATRRTRRSRTNLRNHLARIAWTAKATTRPV